MNSIFNIQYLIFYSLKLSATAVSVSIISESTSVFLRWGWGWYFSHAWLSVILIEDSFFSSKGGS